MPTNVAGTISAVHVAIDNPRQNGVIGCVDNLSVSRDLQGIFRADVCYAAIINDHHAIFDWVTTQPVDNAPAYYRLHTHCYPMPVGIDCKPYE